MKCSGCGGEVASDSSFCANCGTKVGAAPTGLPGDPAAFSLPRSPATGSESEDKLWSGNYSGKAMVGSWLLAGVTSIALIVGCVLFPPGIPVFIGILVVMWLGLGTVLAYRKLSIHYEVTSQRFIHQSGILTRTSDRIEMIDIDDVTFTQGIVERMLSVGTIKLSSSDRTHPVLNLSGIDGVKRVADLIDDARRKERRKRGVHIESI
jgi:membrane protein YdbS with pleckstrin-like domain